MPAESPTTNSDLAGLSVEDVLSIHAVVEKYGFLIDDRAFDRLSEVFTDDARVDYRDRRSDPPVGNGPFDGLVEIERQMNILEHPVQHMLVSHLIDDASDGEVVVRSKAIVPLQSGAVADIEYRDTLVRTPAGWRIRDKSIRNHRPVSASGH